MLVKDLITILSKCNREQPVCLETESGDIQTIWGISENDCRQVLIQGDLYISAEAKEAPICFLCSEEPCIRQERDNYKQALDEIEEFCTAYSDNHDTYETVYKQILDIISKSEEV